jgi:hypothetical protein
MLWQYAKGKPSEHVKVAGGFDLVQRLNAARQRLAALKETPS